MRKYILKICFSILITCYHFTVFAAVEFAIKGVEKEAEENITVFLQELREPKDADNETYLKQVQHSTREALQALGYYQTKLDTVVSGKPGRQRVSVNIRPGMVTRIHQLSVKLSGEGETDPKFKALLINFPLKENGILNHGYYETAKNSLKSMAQQRGYFDAHYEKSLVEVTSKKDSAAVYLWFNTGKRYQFGKLIFDSALPAEKQIRSLQPFVTGEPFDSQRLVQFNTAINETGYFKAITILPEIKEKQGLQIPLHVIATMRPEDSFNIGIGYSTDEGIRGKFRWMRPWANDFGHSIEANVTASIPKQEASLTYKIPLKDPLEHYISMQTGYKMVNQNDTNTTQYLLSINRHWRLSNNWLRTLFIKYNHESGIQGDQDFTTKLIIPGISFRRTRSRGGINTDWGDKLLFSLEASNEWWLSSDDLLKVYGQAKIIRSYKAQQFVAYAEFGAIYTDSIYNVPSSMRFFTGGDQSIRGYDYESIAPTDNSGYLLGGRYLGVASLEYRFSIAENWKLALFTDAGTATNNFSETLSSSAGLGAIWRSPVGPIRFYLAKPFTNSTNSLTLHFILGPEL